MAIAAHCSFQAGRDREELRFYLWEPVHAGPLACANADGPHQNVLLGTAPSLLPGE